MKMKMMKLNRQNRPKFKTAQPLLGGRANNNGFQLKVDWLPSLATVHGDPTDISLTSVKGDAQS